MKRFLLSLILAISFMIGGAQTSFAQTQYFRSTSFAIKYNHGYGWGAWSDWEDSNVKITMDLSNDIVTIYSPTTQILKVVSESRTYVDSSGGRNIAFRAYDLVDDCYCEFRLRMESNGNSQMYLTYSNVCYVYNVIRI